ncbi:fasciclin-like arabinogalactan protein 1-like [Hibiscus syriacus]|uniref:Fasciclin-like arabinogalactan protein 1-like n=1 Tax=Hibiscus syriacus TaxID=106335 RepID=A0A6A2XBS2_HIBSY|nr:heavy metal-associated isoprenylated plant protein 41-like [Hibiscus syriacus]KAE8654127.1 fasciclin-like arabinogalactan protein 1-like [Hibiscus syriacus]
MATREPRNEMLRAENGKIDEEEGKWITHYSSNHQILLVGEGDFSFSLCLANAFASASNIYASSLDSYDDLKKKYKNAVSNLGNLEKLGASLLFEVDATKMKHHIVLANQKFDRIIFNFPHAGFHGREDNARMIRMHKNLVQGFFRSASGMLRANGEIHVNHKTSTPFCLWDLEELASGSSLVLIQLVDFNIKDYPSYQNKRGDGSRCDAPFPLGECSTFKFGLLPRSTKVYKATSRLRSMRKRFRLFQTIQMPMQPQPTSDFNCPQRNHTVDHIPLHVELPSTTSNRNQYSEVLDRNLNGLIRKYERNRYGVAYPERLGYDFDTIPMPMQLQPTCDFNYVQRNHIVNHISLHDGLPSTIPNGNRYSEVSDRNLNELVRKYERNSYGVVYPERLGFDFDARYERRRGPDRQMVELPRTSNGNLNYKHEHEHELRRIDNLRPYLREALACQAYQLNAPNRWGIRRL